MIGPRTRFAIIVTVIGFAILNLGFALWALWARPVYFSDFLAFWSYPRFVAAHGAAGLYDAARLKPFEHHLFPGFTDFYPCFYQPTFLLATWWMGWFGYAAAQIIWTASGIVFLGGVAWNCFDPRHRWFAVLALLGAPAALLNGIAGQTGFFTTGLLLLGFALLPKRPLLAGIAFGLLTLKPQLGVLVPFALLARGEGRAIISATTVASILILLSCLMFPADLWVAWVRNLGALQAQYLAGRGVNLNIMITVSTNLTALGVRPAAASVAQLVCGALVASAVFVSFRRAPYFLAVAALLTGTFLATPHAFDYDSLPLVVALILVADSTPLAPGVAALGFVIYLGPLLLVTPYSRFFFYAVPEVALFCLIVFLALRPTTPRSVGWVSEA